METKKSRINKRKTKDKLRKPRRSILKKINTPHLDILKKRFGFKIGKYKQKWKKDLEFKNDLSLKIKGENAKIFQNHLDHVKSEKGRLKDLIKNEKTESKKEILVDDEIPKEDSTIKEQSKKIDSEEKNKVQFEKNLDILNQKQDEINEKRREIIALLTLLIEEAAPLQLHGGIHEDWWNRFDIEGWLEFHDISLSLRFLLDEEYHIDPDWTLLVFSRGINTLISKYPNIESFNKQKEKTVQRFSNFLISKKNEFPELIENFQDYYNSHQNMDKLECFSIWYTSLNIPFLLQDITQRKKIEASFKKWPETLKMFQNVAQIEEKLKFEGDQPQKKIPLIWFWRNHYFCYLVNQEEQKIYQFNSEPKCHLQLVQKIAGKIKNYFEWRTKKNFEIIVLNTQGMQIDKSQCGIFVLLFLWLHLSQDIPVLTCIKIMNHDLALRFRWMLLVQVISSTQFPIGLKSREEIEKLISIHPQNRYFSSFFRSEYFF